MSRRRAVVAYNVFTIKNLNTINMLFLTLSSLFVASVSALSASSIDSCPTLEPRSQAPTNVSDLRPDDIKVIAAMGDRYVIMVRTLAMRWNNMCLQVLWQVRS